MAFILFLIFTSLLASMKSFDFVTSIEPLNDLLLDLLDCWIMSFDAAILALIIGSLTEFVLLTLHLESALEILWTYPSTYAFISKFFFDRVVSLNYGSFYFNAIVPFSPTIFLTDLMLCLKELDLKDRVEAFRSTELFEFIKQ